VVLIYLAVDLRQPPAFSSCSFLDLSDSFRNPLEICLPKD
jgi:hypothetical protein